ncbi:hypothetical protein J6590_014035 [Homalodisca vitripennis]|nr:hypothetical protein J6590_014035 [Homalodisca vitripennis]
MAEGSSTSAPFRATERVVLDENRILQALQEDVESDVETGAETDVGSDVDEIEEREDDACRNSDTEQSDEDSENYGPVSDDEIPLADRIQVRHRRDHSRVNDYYNRNLTNWRSVAIPTKAVQTQYQSLLGLLKKIEKIS